MHVKQPHTWPHGTAAVFAECSKQIAHMPSFDSSPPFEAAGEESSAAVDALRAGDRGGLGRSVRKRDRGRLST